jgi:hypothetical protein
MAGVLRIARYVGNRESAPPGRKTTMMIGRGT